MHAVSWLLSLCLSYVAHARRNEGCLVDVWRVDAKYEAVLAVDGALELPDREEGLLQLPRGGTVLAGCPGKGNSLKLEKGLPHVNVSCSSAGTLEVSGKKVTAGDLWCERRSLPVAHNTRRHCGPAGKLDVYELGFNVSNSWLPAIEVCHNNTAANTLYSYHHLYGSLLRFRRKPTPRPAFSEGCEAGTLYLGTSPSKAYLAPAVQETLAAALGSQEVASQLLAQSGLSRGHLAPSADFILNTHQHSSFFYANAAPQWQKFNHGNWLSVESMLRNHARRKSLDLKVWTGTHGVLSLYGGEELYLAENQRIAVPHFFWKLVQEPRSGTAIAFVGLNNPFASCSAAKANQLCPNVCGEAGWKGRKWDQPGKGLITCCSAQDLAAAVPGAPQVNASGLLPGPRAWPSARHVAGAK